MTGSAQPDDLGTDTTRAEAFSDGVFAIIITLLVLDVGVPEHEPGGLLEGLLAQWPTYLAYVTSYLYVGVVWLNHKATFRRIQAYGSRPTRPPSRWPVPVGSWAWDCTSASSRRPTRCLIAIRWRC